MAYVALLLGLFTFVLALLLHILFWQFLRPARDLLLLFFLFAIAPVVTVIVQLYLSISYTDSLACTDIVAVMLCYCALSAAYIMTYPALSARCPSLRIVLLIEKGGEDGLSFSLLESGFDTADLVTDRLNELLSSGLVSGSRNAGYRVTWRGKMLLKPFMLFRRFLGLAPGAG